MKDQDVQLHIREGEGLTVEFKERYTPRIDEDLVALANAKGGTVLLGVRDDGSIVGERLTNDLKAKINSLARNCKPGISVNMAQIGKIVAIEIPEGTEKPYGCGSGYYRRLNGTTQKMNHDELRIMFAEHNPLPFEERTIKGFTFEDISPAKIRTFAKEAGITFGKATAPDILRSLGVADESQVKIAGMLFFAKNISRFMHHAQMTAVAYKGTEKVSIYDRRDVRDDLLAQLHGAMAFLQRHLNIRSEIRGVNRYDIPEIPLEALREAVVNALMHRDYSETGTQVQIDISDDRVEISNPGGLPKGLTAQKFGVMSIRRNELLADLFFRLHKVEQVGSGIRKMKKAMAEAGLKPPVFNSDGFFQVTFFRSPEFALKSQKSGSAGIVEGAQKSTQKKAQKSTQKIIEAIKDDPRVTRAELAAQMELSDSGVKKQLKKLQEEGKLKRVGPDKGGHWEVT